MRIQGRKKVKLSCLWRLICIALYRDLSSRFGDTIRNLTFSTYRVKSSYLRILAENFFGNAKKVIVCVTEIDYYDYYDLILYTRMCVRGGVP